MELKIKIVGDTSLASVQRAIKVVTDNLMTEVKTQIAVRTPILTGQARRGWQQRKNTVENAVPYIDLLEKGRSRQAPNGFVKQGIRAAVANVEKKVNK